MKLSLIITTYNWQEALELVLLSAGQQSRPPDEIIVADDGSTDGTGAMIHRLAKNHPVSILHQWQEDKGFRAARCRNLAIAAAQGDYIILIDQDMVLERHFCADHLKAARAGFFVQGSRVLVQKTLTDQILKNQQIGFKLLQPGLENRKNMLRSRLLSTIFSSKSRRLQGIRTCNFGFWKEDALTINGFNEDFVGWGREDSEFAARLLNNGIRRINLKFQALAFHLYHEQACRQSLAHNDLILKKTVKQKRCRCKNGINQHIACNSTSPQSKGETP